VPEASVSSEGYTGIRITNNYKVFLTKYLAKSFPVFSIIRRYPKIYGQVLITLNKFSA